MTVRGVTGSIRMTIYDRAEEFPFLANEFHHLDLFDRVKIGG
jgi:hypothetical protein